MEKTRRRADPFADRPRCRSCALLRGASGPREEAGGAAAQALPDSRGGSREEAAPEGQARGQRPHHGDPRALPRRLSAARTARPPRCTGVLATAALGVAAPACARRAEPHATYDFSSGRERVRRAGARRRAVQRPRLQHREPDRRRDARSDGVAHHAGDARRRSGRWRRSTSSSTSWSASSRSRTSPRPATSSASWR